jgi:hypothetical protein
MQTPRSSISEFIWPGIPSGAAATLMGLQFQLEQSQWWPQETLAALQSRQLQCLLQHAYQPFPITIASLTRQRSIRRNHFRPSSGCKFRS